MQNHNLKLWLGLGTVAIVNGKAFADEPQPTLGHMVAKGLSPVALRCTNITKGLANTASQQHLRSANEERANQNTDPLDLMLILSRIEAQLRAGIDQYEHGHSTPATWHFDTVVAMLTGPMGQILKLQGFETDHAIDKAEVLPIAARQGVPMEDMLEHLGNVLNALDEYTHRISTDLHHHPDFQIRLVAGLLQEAMLQHTLMEQKTADINERHFHCETAWGLIATGRAAIRKYTSGSEVPNQKELEKFLNTFENLQNTLSSPMIQTSPQNGSHIAPKMSLVELAIVPHSNALDPEIYHREAMRVSAAGRYPSPPV